MSKFVNIKKRSITLPPGCKDLIDVLKHKKPKEISPIPSPEFGNIVHAGEERAALSKIGKYVGMAFASRSRCFTLQIMIPVEQLSFDLIHTSESMFATINIPKASDLETKLRAFFERNHLQPPDDSPIPEQFYPDQPVNLMCHITPMPADAQAFAALAERFFREVCGLNEKAELHLRYTEFGPYAV